MTQQTWPVQLDFIEELFGTDSGDTDSDTSWRVLECGCSTDGVKITRVNVLCASHRVGDRLTTRISPVGRLRSPELSQAG